MANCKLSLVFYVWMLLFSSVCFAADNANIIPLEIVKRELNELPYAKAPGITRVCFIRESDKEGVPSSLVEIVIIEEGKLAEVRYLSMDLGKDISEGLWVNLKKNIRQFVILARMHYCLIQAILHCVWKPQKTCG